MTNVRAQPSFVYAPVRFERTRPWSREFRKIFRSVAEANQVERGDLYLGELSAGVAKSMKSRGHPAKLPEVLCEQELMQIFGLFDLHGRRIYDVPAQIVARARTYELMRKRCRELALPETSVYLHFGELDELNIDGVQYEGCFVSWRTATAELSIAFAKVNAFAAGIAATGARSDLLSAPLDCVNLDGTVKEALAATDERLKTQNSDVTGKILSELNEKFGVAQVESWHLREDIAKQLDSIDIAPSSAFPVFGRLVLGTLEAIRSNQFEWSAAWPRDAVDVDVLAAETEQREGRIGTASRTLDKERFCPIYTWTGTIAPAESSASHLRFAELAAPASRTVKSYFDYFGRSQDELALIQEIDKDIKAILRKGVPKLAIGPDEIGNLGANDIFSARMRKIVDDVVAKNPGLTSESLLNDPEFREHLNRNMEELFVTYRLVLNHRLFGENTVQIQNEDADSLVLTPITAGVADFTMNSPAMSFVYTSRGAINASTGSISSPRDVEKQLPNAGYDMAITAAVAVHPQTGYPHPVMTIWAFHGSGNTWPKGWRRMLYLDPAWTWQQVLSTDWERLNGKKGDSTIGVVLDDKHFYQELRPFFNMIVASYVRYGGVQKT
jgi:hypothetical protein